MSPFLLIDAGNTRVKWAESTPRGAIRVRSRVSTRELTARRAAGLAKKYPNHRVVIASVVPAAAKILRRAFGKRAVFVTARTSGLKFAYPRPAEIGADRLAASTAVVAAMRGPAIIVNCGTATVFNVLDAKGLFCGGVIAPGLGTQLAALLSATAQLPETNLRPVPRALGRSTKTAIQAGVILNFQGGVREILKRLRQKSKTSRIILTGGHARYLKDAALGPVELRPLLVFEGLHIIGQRVFPNSV